MFKTSFLMLLLVAGAVSSQASPIFLGVFSGNDHEADVEAAILAATGKKIDIFLYDKSDENPYLTEVTYDKAMKSGTWDVIDEAVNIAFVTVKASNKFAVYQYTSSMNYDEWTTSGILNNGGQQPKLSHLSFWISAEPDSPDNPVPEPSAVLLLGSAAAMFIGCKKYLKK